jgi:group II intron reverse transcriptase/maturase
LAKVVEVGKKYKHHSLIDKVYKRLNLHIAYEKVKAKKGAGGVDRVSLEEFESNLERNLEEIHRLLYEDRYQPHAVRRVYIPKPNGDRRPLGIPSIRDRVVQQAVVNRIGKIFEGKFKDCSYGYRPNRSTRDAIEKVEECLRGGYEWVVEVDIAKFFDTVEQERIIDLVAEEIADGRVLRLIRSFLTSGVMEEMEVRYETTGTPQGGVISPLLANIYLHEFDTYMEERGYKVVRYADDVVILCRRKEDAQRALEDARCILEEKLRLQMNREKTRIVHKSQTFEFLGYLFGHGYSDYKMPRPTSIERFKEKVRYLTRRQQPRAMSEIVERLNPVIRGWGRYYVYGHSNRVFWKLDCWIRDRVRAYKRKKWSALAYQKIQGRQLEQMGLVSLYRMYTQYHKPLLPVTGQQ